MRLLYVCKKSTVFFLTFFLLLFITISLKAQNIAITDDDGYIANESAILDIKSATKGLLIPRLTTEDRITLAGTAVEGLLVFDSEESVFYYFSDGAWVNLSKGQVWTVNSNYVLLSDSTARVGIGTYTPNSKLEVRADASFTDNDTLFAVKDKKGNIVFAVFPDGARVYVNEASKGKVGGFAISGRSPSKAVEEDYLWVTPDSTRIWVNEPLTKGKVGGFAISGRSPSKGISKEYFISTQDSTRIYIDTTSVAKGKVGGFAISGRSPSKGVIGNIMEVNQDSTRIYVTEGLAKGKVGGFAISGRSPSKGATGDYFNVSGNTTADVVNNERRMIWYPQKAALLAGEVHVGSADSVGTNSMAMGYRAISKGEFSQAMGYKTFSEGNYSQAMGNNAKATGQNSTAIGNYAFASAENAFALGDSAIARGIGSYAFGTTGLDTTSGAPTNVQTIANGNHSFAFGFGSYAHDVGGVAIGTNAYSIGEYSMAFGLNDTAYADYSYAIGVNSISDGKYSFAIGASNKATKKGSYAIGNLSIASGLGSFALGYQDTASAVNSFAMGFQNHASNGSAYAIGFHNKSSGIGSFAVGFNNIASGDGSFAIGNLNEAIGNSAFSMGINTTASGDYATSFGNSTLASAGSATAFGYSTIASGLRSVAGGFGTLASGEASTAFGNLTQATNYFATSFGASTVASGHTSTAMGNTITVSGYSSFGIGLNATSYTVTQDNTFAILGGKVGINTVTPNYALDVAGYLNIANGALGTGAIVFRVDGDEALWYNGSVFSWGAGGTSNYFQDKVGIATPTPNVELDINGGLALRQTSPSALTAATHNYNIGTGAYFRISSTGAYNLTGISGGSDGRTLVITNIGANTITFKYEGVLSSAANRFKFSTGADIALAPNHTITLIYDSVSTRWRDIAYR